MIWKDTSKGILLGVPTLGRPLNLHWANAYKGLMPPMNYQTRLMCPWGRPVAEARNMMAQAAIDQGCRYLFMLGDDTQPPGHALHQLVYRAEQNPEAGVIGGIYCCKSTPSNPLVFRGNGGGSFWDWKVGEFFEVGGLGMDCTLIRVDLLREMDPPWFKTIKTDGYLDGQATAESWTEDLWFCQRVTEETDWKIYAESQVMCIHWDYLGGNGWRAYQLPTDSRPYLQTAEFSEQMGEDRQARQILDLGCGPVHHDFKGEGEVTRCDIREECEPDWRIDISGRLPFADEAYDVVFSSHALEHLPRAQVAETLAEWVRVLRPGGELRLIIPNVGWAADRIQEGVVDEHVLNVLYGSQEYGENFHRVGFTPETLQAAVETAGIQEVEVRLEGYNIFLKGVKPDAERGCSDEPGGCDDGNNLLD